MPQSDNNNEPKETAAFIWLIVAMVIGIVLYLSYFFSSNSAKKKETKSKQLSL